MLPTGPVAPASPQTFGGFTRLSKVLAGVLILGYLVQLFVPSSKQYLALVPGRTLPCVWNVFTAGLIETHILQLLLSVAGVLFLSKIVEPVWGSKEFLKFVVFVNAAAGTATFALVVFMYFINRSGQLLYTEISGFHGVFAGLLVAIKQIMPDNEITLLGFLKFRIKHLPGLLAVGCVAGTVIFGGMVDLLPFTLFGIYFAWLYLRFIQYKSETSLKGDPSDEFRFATFFPAFLHPVIDRVAGIFSMIFRLGAPARQRDSKAFVLGGAPLPGSDEADSTRRRERGARALEERLGMKAAASKQPKDLEVGQVGRVEDASQQN